MNICSPNSLVEDKVQTVSAINIHKMLSRFVGSVNDFIPDIKFSNRVGHFSSHHTKALYPKGKSHVANQ